MKKGCISKKIEDEILQMAPAELLQLTELIIKRLKETQRLTIGELDLNELYGKGKGLWEKDAQLYVDSLREDR